MPRGLEAVARAVHRAQPSDPPWRTTEQGRPAAGPLAVRMKPRQRYPTPRRPLGARTLRRHGSCRPRGGFHPPPPFSKKTLKSSRHRTLGFSVSSRRVGGSIARPVVAAMSPEAAGTRRADRDGVSVPRSAADTEGPRFGPRFRVAVEGVSERSDPACGGRASAERPRTRLAKRSHAVKKEAPRVRRANNGPRCSFSRGCSA